MTRDELDLLHGYLDGTMPEQDMPRLQSLLRESAEARRMWRVLSTVDAKLQGLAATNPATVELLGPGVGQPPRRWLERTKVPVLSRQGWQILAWAGAAAGAALLALGVWQRLRPEVEMARGVGHQLAHAIDPAGELVGRAFELSAGLMELRFRRADATVVIEAPAKFRIVDAKTLRLENGRVSAHVRDGKQGLRVLTPEAEVLDLGTRFAVDVPEGGLSEVHVFEGKVAAGATGGHRKELLTRDQALRFPAHAAAQPREVRMGAFVQPEEIKPLARALAAGRMVQAQESRAGLEKDPALLAWLDFNRVTSESSRVGGVEAHGARTVQGRFPGECALEFVDREDHARLNVRARVRQLTLMTWVRLDTVTAERGGLLMVDPAAGEGAVRWLVKPHGQMRFWLVGLPLAESPAARKWPKSSVSVFGDLGVWRHLAVTYDAELRQVRFYVDGSLDSETRTTSGLDAVLAPAIVGSAGKGASASEQPQQRLRGRMDELVILQRVLSAAEIRHQFAAGNPYF